MSLRKIKDRWWWSDPPRALQPAFPRRSIDSIRRYVWPEFERAAYNYELASRAFPGKPKYLLGKRFDCLSAEQMSQVTKVWRRERRPIQPFRLGHTYESSTASRRLELLENRESEVCPTPGASRVKLRKNAASTRMSS